MKVVINSCYGGFGLSHAATLEIARRKGITLFWRFDDIAQGVWDRHNPSEQMTIENHLGVIHYYTAPEMTNESYYALHIDRHDTDLVAVVEQMGKAADGEYAELRVVSIPDGVDYEIDEYDGIERIAEAHRKWYG